MLVPLAFALALALPATAAPSATGATTVTPRASLTNIEADVMCVVCKTPLAVSQSPEADRERAFINGLIAKGETKSQIENALVVQYGPAVLSLPAHGFNLTLYVLPPAVLLLGALGLAYTLPRWRRRTQAAAANAAAAAPPPGPATTDDRRLEEELARYGR